MASFISEDPTDRMAQGKFLYFLVPIVWQATIERKFKLCVNLIADIWQDQWQGDEKRFNGEFQEVRLCLMLNVQPQSDSSIGLLSGLPKPLIMRR